MRLACPVSDILHIIGWKDIFFRFIFKLSKAYLVVVVVVVQFFTDIICVGYMYLFGLKGGCGDSSHEAEGSVILYRHLSHLFVPDEV